MAYFAPEVTDADRGAGLKGFWMGYFAGRAAPMGAVSSPVVCATFFNFAPTMVERAIPDAWSFATPADVLTARLDGVDAALRRTLGDAVDGPEVAEALELADRAAGACSVAGRPLAAAWSAARAHRAAARPPHVGLWLALTVLREHRGDGHVSALVHEGLDGCEAHVSQVATGAVDRSTLQSSRGWTDDEWDAAHARLVARGWLVGDRLTARGAAGRRRVEDATDRLALEPWPVLGPGGTDRLADLLAALASRVLDHLEIPFPNPIGLPRR